MEESVGRSAEQEQSVEVKIRDLTPQSKRVDVTAKCLEVSDPKDIPGKFGNTRRVAEATIADETGAIVLSLWDNQIGSIAKDDVVDIKNGYVSLVRGHMRLNVGKYGQMIKSEKTIESPSTETNMSEKEYEQERRHFGGGSAGRRGGFGGGRDRDRRDRDFERDSDRPSYMNKGRRRF